MSQLIDHTRPLPTAEEMRTWDAACIAKEFGIPEFTLMENAARAALQVLLQDYGKNLHGTHVLLFMGSGNNGGDAACLARHLLDVGALPLVLHTKALRMYSGSTGKHTQLAKTCGVPFVSLPKSPTILTDKHWQACLKGAYKPWQNPHIIIDGLLGTGFNGSLKPSMQYILQGIEDFFLGRLSPYILALDTPSGLDSQNGTPAPIALKAHATACFAAAKPGLILPKARPYTGKVYVCNIGIPKKVQKQFPPSFRELSGETLAQILPNPLKDSHKGTWGHVLVLGGSLGLTGAPHLTAFAALRSGAGLVTVASPSALCFEIKQGLADIMTLPLQEEQTWPSTLPKNLLEKLATVTALAIGPGMGASTDNTVSFLTKLLSYEKRPRAILDADALNIMSKSRKLLKLLRAGDVASPHPKEAARLLACSTEEVQNDRPKALRALAELCPAPVVWILKGAGSLMASKESPIYILPCDIHTLAVGGSGDVLTGCIAALLARKALTEKALCSLCAAALGIIAHATAGHLLLEKFPCGGGMAQDLAQSLPLAMRKKNQLLENAHV